MMGNKIDMTKEKIMLATALLCVVLLMLITISLASAQVTSAGATVCCEKTISGLYCQDVDASQCAAGFRQAPTSCRATSYCKPGVCYDSSEGICQDSTPLRVCNSNNGTWTEKMPAQCELGCCVLGDQAAFVPLVRCKRLSAFLGLVTNYKQEIKDEVSCIMSIRGQEKGACVYEEEFEKRCRLTTRADCENQLNVTIAKTEFFAGKLCSAEELGTKCGPTRNTMCAPGKDEVYFVDLCGNLANIYDASKINDKRYWTDIMDKTEVCNPALGNMNSKTCGNCNYLLGSYCRQAPRNSKATYGDNICADLNCYNTENGNNYKHGESWCVYNDEEDSVGSRFYKHICINGEEVLEQCADYRQHVCIEDKITTTGGEFSQAACRVNRWQDCAAQTSIDNCENSDVRDCKWSSGRCVPKVAPGLKFWEGTEAQSVCAQANAQCELTKTKTGVGGMLGEEISGACKDEAAWIAQQNTMCMQIGDCGGKINWVGAKGYGLGYSLVEGKWKEE